MPVLAANPMGDIFAVENRNQTVLQVEAALAIAQAEFGVIPKSAAIEIKQKADIRFASTDDIQKEYELVQHRMVALLNVWGRSLEGDAAQYVHFGATTVDIYDTVLVLQLLEASELLAQQLLDLEDALLQQAEQHAATPMIGRTLGQHALPITFGKKVSGWLGENRRNIERLARVQKDLRRSAILKGAVGSYVGLGERAIEVERHFASELGLDTPYLDDWHGSRDVFANYAQTLALIARSLGRVGTELFLLQSTDINETVEHRVSTAVGSSTMPHKNNPRNSEALIQYGRSIPRLAEVVLDDVQNYFERDNTSRPNRVLAQISIDAYHDVRLANKLISELIVNEAVMLENLRKTNGLIMSQRLAFRLADELGKKTANDKMHDVATFAIERNISLMEAFQSSDLAQYISASELKELLEPTTYTGLAEKQTKMIIQSIKDQREL